jgi:3-deoxy-manno-octulosonate cytidylyltransferase (CMP-KDO synthetase)
VSVLAVIPARLGASRLPGKPLRLLGGVPLIARVLERVAESGAADLVIVATDSDEVAGVVERAGGRATLTRRDHPSGTDRVAEVVRQPRFSDFDIVLNVQGDEPFVTGATLIGALDMVRSGRFPLGTAAAPANERVLGDADIVKVVCADDGRALYFSRAPIPWCRDTGDAAERRALVRQHIGVYAYRRDALLQWVTLPPHPLERIERLEQLRPLAAGLAMGVALIDALPEGGVDTEDDLARANERWAHLHAGRS